MGWVEPRGEKHGALVESVAGQLVLKLMVESKVVPGGVVAEELAKRVQAIEAQTGRKPGKKEKKELKEDVRNSLLVQAFTKKRATLVWIAPAERLLVVESGSQSHSDEVVTELVKAFEGLAITPVHSVVAPSSAMAHWLTTQDLPSGFTTDRDCILKAQDESKASVRYARHALDIEEIRGHIATGKVPTQLALTWTDRVSFVLTDSGFLRKLEFIGAAVKEHSKSNTGSDFDTDVAIGTGELRAFIPELLEALGGEQRQSVATEVTEEEAAIA